MSPTRPGSLAALLVASGALGALALGGLAPGAAFAAPVGAAVTGQVTYLVGGSVYVSLGAEQGLAAGDTLRVRRNGATIAGLVARDVAARRAACDTLAGGGRIALGDEVAWTAPASRPAAAGPVAGVAGGADSTAAPAPVGGSAGAAAGPATTAPAAPAAMPRRPRPLRGRVGVSAWTTDGGGAGRSVAPAADLRLDARDAMKGVDFALDVRGRGTYRTGGAALTDEEMRARVYRASLSLHDASSGRVLTLGRQIASPLSSVSLFDGALAQATGRRWTGGLLVGTQPEAVHLAPAFDLVEAGGFVGLHAPPGAARRWSATLGAVTSSDHGLPNRDFVFTQGAYQDARASLWLEQEYDVARGWRQAFQPGRVALTSTFASARLDVSRALGLRAGYDGRREVALYRDRLTPETQFDDALRQGAWVGVTLRGGPGFLVDGDVRRRFADVSGANLAWSSTVEWSGARALRPRVRARYARSTSDLVDTDLGSLGFELSPGAASSVGLTGGVRRTVDQPSGVEDRAPWWTLDADVAVRRAWSVGGSFDREGTGGGALTQAYLGIAYRF